MRTTFLAVWAQFEKTSSPSRWPGLRTISNSCVPTLFILFLCMCLYVFILSFLLLSPFTFIYGFLNFVCLLSSTDHFLMLVVDYLFSCSNTAQVPVSSRPLSLPLVSVCVFVCFHFFFVSFVPFYIYLWFLCTLSAFCLQMIMF